jgi:hypothetical protein
MRVTPTLLRDGIARAQANVSVGPGIRAGKDQAPLPKRPYRDAALVYGGMGVAIFLFAWLTGGALAKAVLIAVAFTVLATGWSWFRFRQRLQTEARAARSAPRTTDS